MTALQFPCTIFKTRKGMDDYGASDMRCGDLTEEQLKSHFLLRDISSKVDPYTLTKMTPFGQPRLESSALQDKREKIGRHECAQILFDEFRYLSRAFAVYGPYRHLIEKMINHMQNGNGSQFWDMSMDKALKEYVLNDKSKNSTRILLEEAFEKNIDWENVYFPAEEKKELTKAILRSRLPKFDRFQDNFNGMGISVHDVWATHITIKLLHIENDRFRAVIHYKVQDHFGLDSEDISKNKFHPFRIFRIWFVLQRYNQFGFKPFMTNMEATVEITGSRNENKK